MFPVTDIKHVVYRNNLPYHYQKKRVLLKLKGKLEAAVVIKYHNYIKKMQIMVDNKNRNRFMRVSDKNVLHFKYNS